MVGLGIPPQAAKRIGKNLPGPFDVVLSAGVVSQLVWSCMTELGLEHPALRAVALTAMMTHVCMAATLTRPGGTLILVVDTIARHPDVFAARGDRLSPPELLAHFERRTECLPATELEVVLAALKQAFGNAEIRLATPWLWTIAEHRSSLVYAVTVRGHDSTGAI